MKNMTWTKDKSAGRLNRVFGPWQIALIGFVMASIVTTAYAGPREQAKRIHDRLAGVPPTDAVLQSMENAIQGTEPSCAVLRCHRCSLRRVHRDGEPCTSIT